MAVRPEWLVQFVEHVCNCLHGLGELSPVGCHVSQDKEIWEVSLFASPVEIVGGEFDGRRDQCPYIVDVIRLLKIFDAVESSSWQSHAFGEGDDLRGHFAVVGEYLGHAIWLRVLAEIPADYEPGRYLDVNMGNVIDSWKPESSLDN